MSADIISKYKVVEEGDALDGQDPAYCDHCGEAWSTHTCVVAVADKLSQFWAKFMGIVRDAEWTMFECDATELMDKAVELGLFTFEEWDEVKAWPRRPGHRGRRRRHDLRHVGSGQGPREGRRRALAVIVLYAIEYVLFFCFSMTWEEYKAWKDLSA